jgi:hypothetical protein
MLRNHWPDKIGMGGRILSEPVAGSPRNTQPAISAQKGTAPAYSEKPAPGDLRGGGSVTRQGVAARQKACRIAGCTKAFETGSQAIVERAKAHGGCPAGAIVQTQIGASVPVLEVQCRCSAIARRVDSRDVPRHFEITVDQITSAMQFTYSTQWHRSLFRSQGNASRLRRDRHYHSGLYGALQRNDVDRTALA